jgi:hypothetical protein
MKRLSIKSIFTAFQIIALVGLLSCIAIPTPWTDDKISEEDISEFTQGIFTKDDILKKFGDPDLILDVGNQERVFVYKWERLIGIWLLAGYTGAVGGAINRDKALLVFFDETHHIKRILKASKSPMESYGEFLIRYLKQQKE